MIKKMLKTVSIFLFMLTCTLLFAQRIAVTNARLTVNGSQIYLAGGNTPWNNWNDLGGNYNSSWWDAEFAKIKAAGGNCTRIWITCDGETGFNVNDSGLVSGMTDKFWTDMDNLMSVAQNNQIYVLATLMSFDHVKTSHTNYQRWRNMLTSSSNVDAFANNFVTPLVNRYKNNPYLFAIEPCNEIEWINQNSENGQIAWNYLQYFAAKVFSVVHKNSSILCTIGLSMKWQTDAYSEGNLFSDTRLKAQLNDSSVYLDVYSPHFYDWVIEWFGNPFDTATVASYQLSDKPVIIGEFPANGTGGKSITDCIENLYKNGFQGALPWTTNGVDSNGSLDSGLGAALTAFRNNHPSLINPSGSTGGPTPTATRTPTPTVSRTGTPGPTSGTNLAQGKTATASSAESTNPVTNGNDGNTSTRWCASSANPNEWWRVDLGAAYTIAGTTVMWESGRVYKYKIEVSTNDSTWTQVADKTANTSASQTQTDTFSAVSARYVRITVTGLESGAWASFYEFQVSGSGSNPTPTPTPGMKGDVNNDNSITIVDALMVAQYSVGLNPSGFQLSRADGNCDGSITIVDALIIAQLYVGLISAFPC